MAIINIKQCSYCPLSQRRNGCDYAADIRKETRGILDGTVFIHNCPVYETVFALGDLVKIAALEITGVVIAYYRSHFYIYTHRTFKGENGKLIYTVKCVANDLQLIKARQANATNLLFNIVREYELEHNMETTNIFQEIEKRTNNDIEKTKKNATTELTKLVTRSANSGISQQAGIQHDGLEDSLGGHSKADKLRRVKKRLEPI